jgi:hypothetical protein
MSPRRALSGEVELCARAVDGDDVVEQWSKDLQQRAIAGAHVDGHTSRADERRERAQICSQLLGRSRTCGTAAAREELSRGNVTLGHHFSDPLGAVVRAAQLHARCESIVHHGIVACAWRQSEQQPGEQSKPRRVRQQPVQLPAVAGVRRRTPARTRFRAWFVAGGCRRRGHRECIFILAQLCKYEISTLSAACSSSPLGMPMQGAPKRLS